MSRTNRTPITMNAAPTPATGAALATGTIPTDESVTSELLIPYALNAASRYVVHIDDCERGHACNAICPYCQKPLTAKKGAIRQHHFAHIGEQCLPDHQLHSTAIALTAAHINSNAATRILMPACLQCRQTDYWDLLPQMFRPSKEQWIPKHRIRPDLTLEYIPNPRLRYYIEVVVSHWPEYDISQLNSRVWITKLSQPSGLGQLADGLIPTSSRDQYLCHRYQHALLPNRLRIRRTVRIPGGSIKLTYFLDPRNREK